MQKTINPKNNNLPSRLVSFTELRVTIHEVIFLFGITLNSTSQSFSLYDYDLQ